MCASGVGGSGVCPVRAPLRPCRVRRVLYFERSTTPESRLLHGLSWLAPIKGNGAGTSMCPCRSVAFPPRETSLSHFGSTG